MLRALKWIFYLLVAAVVAVVGGSFFLPSTVTVERRAEIAAPPEKVYAIVSNLKRLNEYSPWAELDPGTSYTFEGPDGQVGQTMRWSSDNPDVGSGTQTIVALQAPSRVESSLDFGEMGTSVASWKLEPTQAGTMATWDLRAEMPGIFGRWIGLMLDRWVGADYEKGLAKLKAVAERPETGG